MRTNRIKTLIPTRWKHALSGAAFGCNLVGPGDVDGDGIPDLLVGAPGVPNQGNRPPGAAFLYRLVHDVVGTSEPPSPQVRVLPNPVRRGRPVILEFSLGLSGPARVVTVLDVRGRAVRRLESALGGRMIWDGRDERGFLAPSGVYSIRSGRGSSSYKLIVLD